MTSLLPELGSAILWVVIGRTLLAGLALALASTPALSTARAQEQATFIGSVSVELVLVPVVVRSRGGYVRNLDAGDFRLFVDERPVDIELFDRDNQAPVTLIFLQDLSGSMANAGRLELSREIFSFFLDRSRPGDQLALATFAGSSMRVDVPLTSDISVLEEAMGLWRAYGTTALHDAVSWLPQIGIENNRAKRAAVLVTDGADNASSITPADARDIVRRAELPVYVLGLRTGDAFAAPQRLETPYRYAAVLNLLAHTTGGSYHSVSEASELRRACEAVAADLRNQYVLGFSTRGAGVARYREVRVEVKGKNRRALHRRGYHGRRPLARGGLR